MKVLDQGLLQALKRNGRNVVIIVRHSVENGGLSGLSRPIYLPNTVHPECSQTVSCTAAADELVNGGKSRSICDPGKANVVGRSGVPAQRIFMSCLALASIRVQTTTRCHQRSLLADVF